MSAAVLKCDAPESDNATLECCLFCVASYHFGREALRVTVDGANDIDRENRVSSEVSVTVITHFFPVRLIDFLPSGA
jgi:hypothetical protein